MLEHTHAFGSYTWISWLALVLGLHLMIVLFALGGGQGALTYQRSSTVI